MVPDLVNVPFQRGDALVSLEAVKFGDALDSDFRQAGHVLIRHLTQQVLDVGFQAFMDGGQNFLPRLALLDVAVDAVFDEDLFERRKMPRLLELTKLNFQLPLEQEARSICTDA